MTVLAASPFEAVLEMIDGLSTDDQTALVEIVRKRLIERRREEIAASAQATVQAFQEGQASYGTVDDLRLAFKADNGVVASRAVAGFAVPVRALFDAGVNLAVLGQVLH